MQEKMTPKRAAQYIQQRYNTPITAAALSAWIRTGRCPFGEYLRKKGSTRGMYLIFQNRLDEYFRPSGNIQQRTEHQIYVSNVGRG